MIAIPPSSICQPTEVSGSRGSDRRGEANEPEAHISAAPTQASSPSTVASPDCSPGRTSSATPAKPTSTEAAPRGLTRSPVAARIRITHSGTEAISSAAMLDGTSCSATRDDGVGARQQQPDERRAGELRARGRTAATPRCSASTAIITAPAIPKRAPAPSSGGIVSTMIRIAR